MTNPKFVTYLHEEEELTLLENTNGQLTAVNVANVGFQIIAGSPALTLNGEPFSMSLALYNALDYLQSVGTKTFITLGGPGSAYKTLFEYYNETYPILKSQIVEWRFNGIDLDVADPASLKDIKMLIGDLRNDFPEDFLITSAPQASSLITGTDPNVNFDWLELADELDWFNAKFYNSKLGTLENTKDFEDIIKRGFNPSQVLAGMLTNPADGSGYLNMDTISITLFELISIYGKEFGGIMGWEWYNAISANGQPGPAGWADNMSTILASAK
ncbi:MAG: hypothetical protein COB20_06050 [SAR86 cluster bacterium]|uniref:GH18 domain-containing protein n=1 Tax=SAR86 cluster bacterium TaxID=2030880 RepID=A0A2A4X9T6_9GAMM|nr:MAG: hypothetical protein COB20_06050 [SAR86 cluster bacterium]